MEKWSGVIVLCAFFSCVVVVALFMDHTPARAGYDFPNTRGYDLQPFGASAGSMTDFVFKTGDTMSGELNMGGNGITDVDWTRSNDGDGSSLDADLLDGEHATFFMAASEDNWVNVSGDTMAGALSMGNNGITNIDWPASDDGTDSGLDADLLDGQHGTDFMAATTDNWVNITGDTMSGALNLEAAATLTTAGHIIMNGANTNLSLNGANDIHLNGRNLRMDVDDSLRIYSSGDDALNIANGNDQWQYWIDGNIRFKSGGIYTYANDVDIVFIPHGTGIVTSAARIAATATFGPLNLGGAAIDGHTLGDNDVIIGGTRFEIDAESFFDAPIHLPPVVGDSISEPFACNGGVPAATVYCDDTDDTSWAAVCICALLDGTGWDWRDLSDISGTACPCF